MAFRRRSRRRNEAAAWAVAAGAAVGAGGAILYLLEPARRARVADAARRVGRRAADAARRSRASAVERGAARARGLAASARKVGEEAGAKAQALAGDLRARACEVKGQLEELERRGEGRDGSPGAAAAVLLGRAFLGKGLLRVPFGLAGLSLVGRTAPVRHGATAAARMARSAAGALRTQRERLRPAAAPGAARPRRGAAGDADHPSVAGVGEVRDPVEASGRELPRPEAQEEDGPGLQAAGDDEVERGPEAESAPLVTAPDAALPDADGAPRIEAPDERHVDRAGRRHGGAGPSYDLR